MFFYCVLKDQLIFRSVILGLNIIIYAQTRNNFLQIPRSHHFAKSETPSSAIWSR